MLNRRPVRRRRSVVTAALLVAGAVVLAGCAASAPDSATTAAATTAAAQPAGFWLGLWHGLICPITFLVSLFNSHVGIYEVHNSGGWYDFGFVLGLSVAFGGASRSGNGAGRRSRTPRRDGAAPTGVGTSEGSTS